MTERLPFHAFLLPGYIAALENATQSKHTIEEQRYPNCIRGGGQIEPCDAKISVKGLSSDHDKTASVMNYTFFFF